ncbi:MAG: prepilin peptidase, partial [Flavobacteriales bacterium]|nr:prepilin peptidase [Flavobacteriales bacterium]
MIFFFFFLLGSIWGSFSNVCIYRLPKEQGVALSRSTCPKCKKMIKWYDNIPLISFLILKRKCRNCNFKINFQYFIVELIGALSFCLIYYVYGISFTTLLL